MNTKNIEIIFIILLILLGIYYIYLASGTQMLGEDEAGYVRTAKEFSQLTYPAFHPYGVHNCLSPFVSLILSFFIWIFGSANILALGKMLVAFFGILTLLVVYLIGKRENLVAGVCSAILLFFIPAFTHSMFLLYLEVPIAFFSALSLYLFLKMGSTKSAILLGLVLGISNYVKASGMFLIIGFFAFVIIKYVWKRDKNLLKLTLISIIIASIIIFPLLIRNIILYNYPYVEGLNILFNLLGIKSKETAIPYPEWIGEVTQTISPQINYPFYIGWGSIILTTFGAVWAYYSKNNTLLLSMFLILLFFVVYFIRGVTGIEPRYLSIIYPFFSIIGGIYLGTAFDKAKASSIFKWLVLIIIFFILIFSVQTSFNSAIGTHDSVRYSPAYVESIRWLEKNTPEDSIIFTPLGGAVEYYGDRISFWAKMEEFPEIMSTDDATFIKDVLEKYNITHVLVWRGVVADSYIVPESNFIGLFTYSFVNAVSSNSTIFDPVFSNQDTLVFEVL